MALSQQLAGTTGHQQRGTDFGQAPHPFAQDAREPSIDWARVLRPSERLRASSWGDSLVNAGGEDQGSKQQRFSMLLGDGKMESATADKLRRQGSASSLVQTQSYESPPGDWWVALRVSFQNAALHCSMYGLLSAVSALVLRCVALPWSALCATTLLSSSKTAATAYIQPQLAKMVVSVCACVSSGVIILIGQAGLAVVSSVFTCWQGVALSNQSQAEMVLTSATSMQAPASSGSWLGKVRVLLWPSI
ncbi:hypothetical protein V8C44DRAFT_104626 [Trichoderma aethiopicum]